MFSGKPFVGKSIKMPGEMEGNSFSLEKLAEECYYCNSLLSFATPAKGKEDIFKLSNRETRLDFNIEEEGVLV